MAEKKIGETACNPLSQFAEAVRTFPVRIGAPSYVWPGGYSHNAGLLSPVFSEIQVLVLESLEISPIDAGEIESLKKYADEGINYSVHLPVPSGLTEASGDKSPDGTPDPVSSIVNIIETFKPLNVSNYVLHIDWNDAFDAEILNKRLLAIADNSGIAIETLCVENIDATFDKIWERVGSTGLSICCDVGHLLHAGEDPFRFIDKYEKNIRMVHIHGAGKKDHIPLTAIDPKMLVDIIGKFAEMNLAGPVIIENYSVEDMQCSLAVLESLLKEGFFGQCPV
jgi:sugar phosphate isomerase/epimerase